MHSLDSPQEVREAGSLHRYRTEIPNLIEDSDLSVYAFRLYAHYKRVAGDTGRCFEGTRGIAKACKMSPGSVSNARKELETNRLIKVTPGNRAAGEADIITICDIWEENFRGYGRAPLSGEYCNLCSPHEQRTEEENNLCSPHEHPRSPHEQVKRLTCSPYEHKKNSIKKNVLKKEHGDAGDASGAPSAKELEPSPYAPEASPFGYFCYRFKERYNMSAHIQRRDIAAKNASTLATKYTAAVFVAAVSAFFSDERKAARGHLWEEFYADFQRYALHASGAVSTLSGSGGLADTARGIEQRLTQKGLF